MNIIAPSSASSIPGSSSSSGSISEVAFELSLAANLAHACEDIWNCYRTKLWVKSIMHQKDSEEPNNKKPRNRENKTHHCNVAFQTRRLPCCTGLPPTAYNLTPQIALQRCWYKREKAKDWKCKENNLVRELFRTCQLYGLYRTVVRYMYPPKDCGDRLAIITWIDYSIDPFRFRYLFGLKSNRYVIH